MSSGYRSKAKWLSTTISVVLAFEIFLPVYGSIVDLSLLMLLPLCVDSARFLRGYWFNKLN